MMVITTATAAVEVMVITVVMTIIMKVGVPAILKATIGAEMAAGDPNMMIAKITTMTKATKEAEQEAQVLNKVSLF